MTMLTTKLHVPPPPAQILVPRPRLSLALSKALLSSLTLVSAPAGYGKTTLVSSWLSENDFPSTWLSLDEGDNDPLRFLQYFLSALQQIVPTAGLDLLNMLQDVQPPPFEAFLSLLVNEIEKISVHSVFILDDFHRIDAQPVVDMLTFLLEHLPPHMHMVLLSRTDPLLPLSRFRVRNQLVDIRADQLRFSLDEIAVFLNDVMGLDLSATDIAALERRTEGWIASLQLAALPNGTSKMASSLKPSAVRLQPATRTAPFA
jgi:LuxR family transcriptional regulator, maltose regulon positive regulatory protein